ncbi:competence type IV pilus minor pilin ComGD [Neobacillus sp. LXY-4]|uniref:competence type IV pilus minor pilin ComGD n=1 Tax=Neobacillus sp. LXY-4 TaxID=3379826 RepID=UPI003EE3E69A
MDWNEKGFTLTETLLVFSIFLVISFASLFLLKPQYYYLEKSVFFSQLKSDLFLAQQYAISHQTTITVNIMSERNYYYFRENINGPILLEREYSNEIKITEGTLPLYFQFLADGNISRFGSFFIRIGAETYRMTFQIGKGRFYVTKE